MDGIEPVGIAFLLHPFTLRLPSPYKRHIVTSFPNPGSLFHCSPTRLQWGILARDILPDVSTSPLLTLYAPSHRSLRFIRIRHAMVFSLKPAKTEHCGPQKLALSLNCTLHDPVVSIHDLNAKHQSTVYIHPWAFARFAWVDEKVCTLPLSPFGGAFKAPIAYEKRRVHPCTLGISLIKRLFR